MTLAEFATNVVPVINMVIAGLGLLSLLGLFWQIRETRLWNKINTQHHLVDSLPTQDLERQVYVALAKFQIPRDGTIAEAAATALYDDIRWHTSRHLGPNRAPQPTPWMSGAADLVSLWCPRRQLQPLVSGGSAVGYWP